MKAMLLLLSPLFVVVVVGSDVAGDDHAEREALIDFGNSLDYKKWTKNTHWNTDKSICDWHGVTCTSGHVTSIRFGVWESFCVITWS